MMSVLGLLAAGLGCKHVGGKCDCGANTTDAIVTGPMGPYPAAPALGAAASPIPPAVPTGNSGKPPVPMPMPK